MRLYCFSRADPISMTTKLTSKVKPMTDLSNFPITSKWPAKDPSVIQLYSFPTPNGIKASAMLEETGLPYEPHKIGLGGDTTTPEFLSLNPNNKIPAIIDPDGPDGAPMGIWESGSILIYLAEKSGKFYGANATERHQINQWIMFQMGGLGPMMGQFGFFHKFAGKEIEDPRPKQRYIDEVRRLLGVLDRHLDGKDYVVGDAYSIADIASWPWVRAFVEFYEGGDLVGYDNFKNVQGWLERCAQRPASIAALNIPDRNS